MTDTQTRGMDIAPDVLDTIVALALKDVEGVAVVGQTSTGILSFFGSKQDQKGVRVSQVTSDTIDVSVSITVLNGFSLDKIAADARKAIADAILAQTGYTVNRVDIHVDGILFRISTRSWPKNINMTEARRAVLPCKSSIRQRSSRLPLQRSSKREGSSMRRSSWVTMLAA